MEDTNALSAIVKMFQDAKVLYWIITIYSIVVGGAMTYFGRRHYKKLLFFVGAFTVYVPTCYFASTITALIAAIVGGLIMVVLYPVYVFFIGVVAVGIPCVTLGLPVMLTGILELAGGIFAIIYRKHIVIPISSISGAWMLAFGLLFLFGGMAPTLFLVLFLAFIVSGIFVQYKFTAKDLVNVPLTPAPAEAPAEAK